MQAGANTGTFSAFYTLDLAFNKWQVVSSLMMKGKKEQLDFDTDYKNLEQIVQRILFSGLITIVSEHIFVGDS